MNDYSLRIKTFPVICDNQTNKSRGNIASNKEFKDVLKESVKNNKIDLERLNFKISAHAEKRMEERNILLPREDLIKIENAFNKLEEKGSRESLILYKNLAFISSVKNRTIITALDKDEIDLVTNIDSTIMIK